MIISIIIAYYYKQQLGHLCHVTLRVDYDAAAPLTLIILFLREGPNPNPNTEHVHYA